MKYFCVTAFRSPQLPAAAPLAKPLDWFLSAMLALLGLVVPYSTAGVSAVLAVLLVFALTIGLTVWRTAPWRDPVVAVGLGLFAYIVAHTLLTSGWNAQSLQEINKYHELLLAAVLFALFRLARRPQAFLYGLAVGALGYALVHWALFLDLPRTAPLASPLSARSISAGFVLAITAFVLFDQAASTLWPRLMRLASFFLALSVVFVVAGRTGQVVLALLVVYAIWTHGKGRWRGLFALGLAIAMITTALTYGAARNRLDDTRAALEGTAGWQSGSTGERVGMWLRGVEMAKSHFIAGVGYARYAEAQAQTAIEVRGRKGMPLSPLEDVERGPNPHNEYLKQLVSGGIAALALFLVWLALPVLRRKNGRVLPSLVALSAAFAIGCLFNSLLRDFTEAHFHMAVLTWLLAQTASTTQASPTQAG